MAATNPVTGDSLQTKATTDTYRDNWDRIFNRPTDELGERIDLDDEALKELEKQT